MKSRCGIHSLYKALLEDQALKNIQLQIQKSQKACISIGMEYENMHTILIKNKIFYVNTH